MIFAMNESKYEKFGEYMNKIDKKFVHNIAHNIRCYDYFLTYPDDAPIEEIEIVKKGVGY